MVTGDYYYDDTVQLRVKRLCMVAVGAKKRGRGGRERGKEGEEQQRKRGRERGGIRIQGNRDTMGPKSLSFVERSSLCRRSNNTLKVLAWG